MIITSIFAVRSNEVCIMCTFFPNLIILDDAETMKKKKDSFEYMYLARPRLRKHFYE